MSVYGYKDNKDDKNNKTAEEQAKKQQDENVNNQCLSQYKDLWIWAESIEKLEEVEYFNSPWEHL